MGQLLPKPHGLNIITVRNMWQCQFTHAQRVTAWPIQVPGFGFTHGGFRGSGIIPNVHSMDLLICPLKDRKLGGRSVMQHTALWLTLCFPSISQCGGDRTKSDKLACWGSVCVCLCVCTYYTHYMWFRTVDKAFCGSECTMTVQVLFSHGCHNVSHQSFQTITFAQYLILEIQIKTLFIQRKPQ